MKNVKYTNAGAGSGKTYTLTTELARLIRDEHIRPEQVIMTTFTIKAASEFKTKAKVRLHEAGLHEEASRLDQALIGTIHSVCQRMIDKYWYYLGLSPQMNVMDENAQRFYTSQSLATLATETEQEKLNGFVRFFGIKGNSQKGEDLKYGLWQDQLKAIINGAINYEITDFSRSLQESLDFLRQFVKSGDSLSDIDSVLAGNLAGMLAEAKAIASQKDTLPKYQAVHDEIERRQNDRNISWYKLVLENLSVATRFENYKAVCAQLKTLPLWTTKEVYERQADYLRLLFKLAGRWRERFLQFKRDNNLLDFNDMEHYMLQLLENPVIADEIAQSYRYLFVDEFQDCSPIQVKIFDKLSDRMAQSYWVGDYKQAIYGFRGSDTTLTKSVVDRIASKEKGMVDGCKTDTLDTSYRSQPDIVNVNNEIFLQAFNGVLADENIKLASDRVNEDGTQSLRYFRVEESDNGEQCGAAEDQKTDETEKQGEGKKKKKSKQEIVASSAAAYVAHLIKDEKVNPSDIAVLGRKHSDLDPVAAELVKLGVKVDRANLNVADSRTWQLVSALLRIVASADDNLAKAQVAMLTDNDFTTAGLIDKKLLFDQETDKKSTDFLAEQAFVSKVLARRTMLRQQSVAAMVESLIIELGLGDVAVCVETNPTQTASCLETVRLAARTYEDYCLQMSLPATVHGFISYITTADVKCGSDPEGVHVVTYHGSKGLEWPYVVMLSLNEDIKNEKSVVYNEVYGVHYAYDKLPSEENPYPPIYIRAVPFIYGANKNTPVPEPLRSQIVGSQLYADVLYSSAEEAKRLLYVGMTRPRDVLVLAAEPIEKKESKPKKESKKKSQKELKETKKPKDLFFSWFTDSGINLHATLPTGTWYPFGPDYAFEDVSLTAQQMAVLIPPTTVPVFKQLPIEANKPKAEEKLHDPKEQPAKNNPRYISPSGAKGTGTIVTFHDFGKRITLNGTPAMDEVGNCIHQVFAGIELGVDIQEVIKQYGLTATLPKPADIRMAWQQLCDHLTATYGTGCTFHERPFRMERGGQTVVGSIDLVWQTAEGDYLIDFKTYPGDKALEPNDKHFVGHYAGQLGIYKKALEAAGEKVLKCFIYYPVGGLLAEVGLEQ